MSARLNMYFGKADLTGAAEVCGTGGGVIPAEALPTGDTADVDAAGAGRAAPKGSTGMLKVIAFVWKYMPAASCGRRSMPRLTPYVFVFFMENVMEPFVASGVERAGLPQGSGPAAVEVDAKTESPSWHWNCIFAAVLACVAHERVNEPFDASRVAELVNSLTEGLAGSGAPCTSNVATLEWVAS